MLITGKEDLRVQKTIAAIKEAFEELICEKEYADAPAQKSTKRPSTTTIRHWTTCW